MGVAKCRENRRLMLFADAHSIWTEGRLPRERPDYAKIAVKVRQHMDGCLSAWHGPRLIQRFGADGWAVLLA